MTTLFESITRLWGRAYTEGMGWERFERELQAAFTEAERDVIAEKLSKYDLDVPRLVVNGITYRQALRATTTCTCGAGDVQEMRSLYRHQAEPAIAPLELNTGLVEGHWTPLAARPRVLAMTEMTPATGAELFAELGRMTPSKSSLDRLPKALSAVVEADRERFEQDLRAAQVVPAGAVAVSLDGVMTPMQAGERQAKREQATAEGKRPRGPAGYQEVDCGTISFYDAEGERMESLQFARMPAPKKKHLKRQLAAEREHFLAQQPDLQVVTIADGAKDNWTFLTQV